MDCRNSFDALVAIGCVSMLALQSFIIIGGVTKFIPLTGITMPFVSYGGSSILSCFFILGILEGLAVKNGDADEVEFAEWNEQQEAWEDDYYDEDEYDYDGYENDYGYEEEPYYEERSYTSRRNRQTAVSYTHLDVYKRQILSKAAVSSTTKGRTAYNASKAGGLGFTKALAGEVIGDGIRVNGVLPGFVRNSRTDKLFETDFEAMEIKRKRLPTQQFGMPEDIGVMVAMLASEKFKLAIGSIVDMTGGLLL